MRSPKDCNSLAIDSKDIKMSAVSDDEFKRMIFKSSVRSKRTQINNQMNSESAKMNEKFSKERFLKRTNLLRNELHE